jgi:hypothetical protein
VTKEGTGFAIHPLVFTAGGEGEQNNEQGGQGKLALAAKRLGRGINWRNASKMRESWHGFSNQEVCHVCCLLGVMMNDFNNMQAIIQVLSLSQQHCAPRKVRALRNVRWRRT